ncbi:MAG: cytochrome c [Gammaproteobacteria bacterium]
MQSRRHFAGVGAAIALAFCTDSFAYEPATNYALHCMGCHTPDGAGIADRVPSIRDTLLLFARMPEGRRFLVQVPGSAQSTLSDAELAKLLNWMVRTLGASARADSFVAFTEREVTEYRVTPLLEVRATREALLRASRERP